MYNEHISPDDNVVPIDRSSQTSKPQRTPGRKVTEEEKQALGAELLRVADRMRGALINGAALGTSQHSQELDDSMNALGDSDDEYIRLMHMSLSLAHLAGRSYSAILVERGPDAILQHVS